MEPNSVPVITVSTVRMRVAGMQIYAVPSGDVSVGRNSPGTGLEEGGSSFSSSQNDLPSDGFVDHRAVWPALGAYRRLQLFANELDELLGRDLLHHLIGARIHDFQENFIQFIVEPNLGTATGELETIERLLGTLQLRLLLSCETGVGIVLRAGRLTGLTNDAVGVALKCFDR